MKKIVLQISGMTCSACSSGLEKYLKKQKGIDSASVNLILSTATITYENISVKTIEHYIEEAGFKSEGEFKSIKHTENRKSKKRNLIGMGLLLVLFYLIVMGPMLGLPKFPYISMDNPKPYVSFSFIISLFFLFYGFDILKMGIKNVLHRIPNMDSLVFFSVFFSFSYSIYGMIQIFLENFSYVHHLYFEAICMVIYFIKLGRYLEGISKDKTKDAIRELVQVTPKYAIKKDGNGEKQVSIDEVNMGDILIARIGEKIAVDGEITKGKTYVDESFLTGESKPVLKTKGDKVIAGSINYEEVVEYKAVKIGKSSTISEIVNLVVEATNSKSKTQKIADKLSSYFVPFVFLFAFLTCGMQLMIGLSFEEVFLHFITIFVVACPCALGLAVPLVVVVENSKCARLGLFLRNSEVLEKAKHIDTIVFDKTGTLTYGKLKVHKCYNYLSIKEKDLLNLVANIESFSTHPIHNAFAITKKLNVTHFKNYEGMGISGEILHNTYYIGNEKLLDKRKIKEKHKKDCEKLLQEGCSILYVVENEHVIGLIGVKDIVREEAKDIVKLFYQEGIEVVMLTGDHEITANIIASELGIKKVVANCLPKEKAEFIEKLVHNGHKVIMVGDGLNDAPALVSATIGISVNDGTDVAHDASEVILMNNNSKTILDFLHISKEAVRVMYENLVWAFLYNLIMLPIAIGLLEPLGIKMNPAFGSLAMVLSSLTVTINALRLNRKEGKKK